MNSFECILYAITKSLDIACAFSVFLTTTEMFFFAAQLHELYLYRSFDVFSICRE